MNLLILSGTVAMGTGGSLRTTASNSGGGGSISQFRREPGDLYASIAAAKRVAVAAKDSMDPSMISGSMVVGSTVVVGDAVLVAARDRKSVV